MVLNKFKDCQLYNNRNENENYKLLFYTYQNDKYQIKRSVEEKNASPVILYLDL